jgi:hypothetical protein
MEDINKCDAPATTTPVVAVIDGELFKEDWEYGLLICLYCLYADVSLYRIQCLILHMLCIKQCPMHLFTVN